MPSWSALYPPAVCRACGREMSFLGEDAEGMRLFRCFRPECGRSVRLRPTEARRGPPDAAAAGDA
jgi:predicted RNA-binding Zn-ribbon protein involved in translation (DUF1610 family)